MTKNQYLQKTKNLYDEGKISAEAYDARIASMDALTFDEEDDEFVDPRNMHVTYRTAKDKTIVEFAFNDISEFIEKMSQKENAQKCTDVIVTFVDTGKRHQFYTIKEAIAYYRIISNQKSYGEVS